MVCFRAGHDFDRLEPIVEPGPGNPDFQPDRFKPIRGQPSSGSISGSKNGLIRLIKLK